MKSFFVSALLLYTNLLYAQSPTYQEKLFYTCKIWGFVKYYHSEVSVCKVNWDSVLVRRLPAIKAATGIAAFNNELDTLLQAAGPMALATTPAPAAVAPELKRNLDFSWMHDPLLRSDIQIILDTIRNNFRPHEGCWVKYNDFSTSNTSYLTFPYDSLMNITGVGVTVPNEAVRAALLFKYWNIIRYFNPYNYVLDQSWDTTLYQYMQPAVTATNPKDFYVSFKKIVAQLNDPHAEGLTYSYVIDAPLYYYTPKLLLRYIEHKYVVVKSGITGIETGTVIDSVAGISVAAREDSLRPYISAGNQAVFRRMMCQYLLNGSRGSSVRVSFTDRSGVQNAAVMARSEYMYLPWFSDYYPNDSLAAIHWKKLNCDIGYVHMGNLTTTDIPAMYDELRSLPAIIFDIRNYPKGTLWTLAPLLFPGQRPIARFQMPDIAYPGTYTYSPVLMGVDGNPDAYKGKIIILANEQTQSQAEYTCMGLKAMDDVVVVGSQTAGTDGNISYFKLASDLQTGFTTLGTYYANGDSTQRIGIVPDSLSMPTRAGVIERRDEVLEKALQIAGCIVAINERHIAPTQVSFYPDPASDKVSLSWQNLPVSPDSRVVLHNMLGQSVLSRQLSSISGSLDINVSHLPAGMYLLTVLSGGEQTYRHKLIVVR